MKRPLYILISFVLAGCAGYGYPVKDAGDGVFYAASPPVYSYVDMYFGFPYYGPYSWAWYYPVWYSPVMGSHYSWYRSLYDYWWEYPHIGPHAGFAYHGVPRRSRASDKGPGRKAPSAQPIPPVDLGQAVITSQRGVPVRKTSAYRSSDMKYRGISRSSRMKSPPTTQSKAPRPSYRPMPSPRYEPQRRGPARRPSSDEN